MTALDHCERALVLASVGMAAEVVFTAYHEHHTRADHRRLIGFSYVWMIPIYALLYPGLR